MSLNHQHDQEARLAAAYIKAAFILSIVIGLIGCAVLIGWAFDIRFLISITPNLFAMKANAAFAFICISIALLLQHQPVNKVSVSFVLSKLLALLVFLIGILTFTQHATGINFHIDQFIFLQLHDNYLLGQPGRMAPLAAITFALTGIAIFLIDFKKFIAVKQILAYLIGLIGIFIIMGITYHIKSNLHLFPFAFASLHAAFAFLFISLALFFMRPNEGAMVTIVSATTGGTVARVLIPAIIIITTIIGYLRLLLVGYLDISYESGTGIFSISMIAIFTLIIISLAHKIMLIDTEKSRIENQLRSSLDEIDDIYNHSPCGYHSLDSSGIFLRINDTELKWLGYSRDEVIGKMKFIDLLTPQGIVVFQEKFPLFKKYGHIENLEYELIKKDKSVMTVILNASAIKNERGEFVMSRSATTDITKLKITTSQLNAAMQKSDQSNFELQQFANIVSHDLQEPLRTITSFVQLLAHRNQDKLDKESIEFMAFITDGAKRMQKLINDLLEFSRVTTKAKPFTTTDSNQAVQSTLNALNTQITEHQAVVTVDSLPTISCDETQLMQVFQNLISNAIKFCERKPVIHISAVREQNAWTFSITDNGIGIPANLMDQLFLPFKRLNPAAKYPGTGMGLAICKKIIDRHGGKIWAASQPDVGSTFYFTIPDVQNASLSPTK